MESIERHPEHPDVVTINMGPSHPATHGVLRLVLQLDGERVALRAQGRGDLADRDLSRQPFGGQHRVRPNAD